MNCAGVFFYKPIAATEEEEFDLVFNSNLKGALFAAAEAAKVIKENGRIINISTSIISYIFPLAISALH